MYCGQCSRKGTLPYVGQRPTEPGSAVVVVDSAMTKAQAEELRRILHAAGWERDAYITHAMACCDKFRAEDVPKLQNCIKSGLYKDLYELRPKVVLAVGPISAMVLLGASTKIGTSRGKLHQSVVGKIEDRHVFNVVPTWAIGYTHYKPNAADDIIADAAIAINSTEERIVDFRYLNDAAELVKLTDYLCELAKDGDLPLGAVGIDIETTTIIYSKSFTANANNPHEHIGTIQIAWDAGKAVCIPVVRDGSVFNDPVRIKVLQNCLSRIAECCPVVGHNFIFDETFIARKLNVRFKHVVCDTLLAHHYIDVENSHALDYLIPRYLGRPSHKGIIEEHLLALPQERRSYANLPQHILVEYGCEDAEASLLLYSVFRRRMEMEDYSRFEGRPHFFPNAWEAFTNVPMAAYPAFVTWQLNGAFIDVNAFPAIDEYLTGRMEAARRVITATPFFAEYVKRRTVPNPKRNKPVRVFRWVPTCDICCHHEFIAPPKPKNYKCRCGNTNVKWNRKQVETGEFVIDEKQPEYIYPELNLNSHQQCAILVYDIMRLPEFEHPQHRDKKRSTDKHLKELHLRYCGEHNLKLHTAVLKAMQDFNKASKLYSSYVKKLPTSVLVRSEQDQLPSLEHLRSVAMPAPIGTAHTFFKQAGTKTGRISTENPPLQTIPKDTGNTVSVKQAFASRFGDCGLILQADFSAAEVRCLVIETKDENLKGAFDRGEDVHKATAARSRKIDISEVTGDQRQAAKITLFGLIYGRGPGALAAQLGISVEEARQQIVDWFNGAPAVRDWIEWLHDMVPKWGATTTLLGRVRDLSEFFVDRNNDGLWQAGLRRAVNTPIQGLAGELCTMAAAKATYRFEHANLTSCPSLTVHDSFVADIHTSEILTALRIVREEMVDNIQRTYTFVNLRMETDIEIGPNWGSLAKVKEFGDDYIKLQAKSQEQLLVIVNRLSSQHKVSMESYLPDPEGSSKVTVLLRLAPKAQRIAV